MRLRDRQGKTAYLVVHLSCTSRPPECIAYWLIIRFVQTPLISQARTKEETKDDIQVDLNKYLRGNRSIVITAGKVQMK